MTTYAAQAVPVGGVVPTAHSAASGDKVSAEDDVIIIVSTSGTLTNLTIATPGTVDGLAIADKVIALTSTQTQAIKMSKSDYADAQGLADLSWSSVTGVTFTVLRVA